LPNTPLTQNKLTLIFILFFKPDLVESIQFGLNPANLTGSLAQVNERAGFLPAGVRELL